MPPAELRVLTAVDPAREENEEQQVHRENRGLSVSWTGMELVKSGRRVFRQERDRTFSAAKTRIPDHNPRDVLMLNLEFGWMRRQIPDERV